VLLLGACAVAQTAGAASQLLLENDFVRVSRITIAPRGSITLTEKTDAVLLRISSESAEFMPKGKSVQEANASDAEAVDLVIALTRHWDAEVLPCSYPKQCTRTTQMGGEPIAWTTTLFTNGFITASTHKVVRGGTLTSSYYTARGSDKIVVVPFTKLTANFGGTEEALNAGEPYFAAGTEVEVTANDAESRWFVLRINVPK
jgi:hypothetical protein